MYIELVLCFGDFTHRTKPAINVFFKHRYVVDKAITHYVVDTFFSLLVPSRLIWIIKFWVDLKAFHENNILI